MVRRVTFMSFSNLRFGKFTTTIMMEMNFFLNDKDPVIPAFLHGKSFKTFKTDYWKNIFLRYPIYRAFSNIKNFPRLPLTYLSLYFIIYLKSYKLIQ